MLDFVLRISHYALPLLAVAVLALCLSALLKRRAPSLGEARLINTVNGDSFPLPLHGGLRATGGERGGRGLRPPLLPPG